MFGEENYIIYILLLKIFYFRGLHEVLPLHYLLEAFNKIKDEKYIILIYIYNKSIYSSTFIQCIFNYNLQQIRIILCRHPSLNR